MIPNPESKLAFMRRVVVGQLRRLTVNREVERGERARGRGIRAEIDGFDFD
jgi:hypothetical protein